MAPQKSNKLLYIGVAVVVLLVAFLLFAKSKGMIGSSRGTEVEVATVIRLDIVEQVSASGMVQPEVEVKLSPDVSGEIVELNVDEGDSVLKGQLLIRIREDNYKSLVERSVAALNQQRANLASSRASQSRMQAQFDRQKLDFARNKTLRDQEVISLADYQTADANYKIAEQDLEAAKQGVQAALFMVKSSQASVDEARENLRRTQVVAPMSGTVSKLSVELGERVVGTLQMTGTEMLRIADLNVMEVVVNVNENDIIRVMVNDTVVIDVDSYSHLDKKFKGRVTEIANTANAKASIDAVTEFEVKIRILNESYIDLLKNSNAISPFRPGMTASVDIVTDGREAVLSVPLSAVTTRIPEKKNNKKGGENEDEGLVTNEAKKKNKEIVINEVVFVKDGDKAKMVEVKTGISDYDNIEILEGLEEGQEIIIGPFREVSKNLSDGDLIKVKEKKEDEDDE